MSSIGEQDRIKSLYFTLPRVHKRAYSMWVAIDNFTLCTSDLGHMCKLTQGVTYVSIFSRTLTWPRDFNCHARSNINEIYSPLQWLNHLYKYMTYYEHLGLSYILSYTLTCTYGKIQTQSFRSRTLKIEGELRWF